VHSLRDEGCGAGREGEGGDKKEAGETGSGKEEIIFLRILSRIIPIFIAPSLPSFFRISCANDSRRAGVRKEIAGHSPQVKIQRELYIVIFKPFSYQILYVKISRESI
jgi:hypothetical protein